MDRADVVDLVVELVDVDLGVDLVVVDLDVDLVDVDLVDVNLVAIGFFAFDFEVDVACDRITRQECLDFLVLKNAPKRTSQYVNTTVHGHRTCSSYNLSSRSPFDILTSSFWSIFQNSKV